MQAYQKNCPINRPVLAHPPWWQVDIQSLPPRYWCERCGAEVYAPMQTLCPGCIRPKLKIEN